MFDTLVESGGSRRHSTGHSMVAALVHAALLMGAIGATRGTESIPLPIVDPMVEIPGFVEEPSHWPVHRVGGTGDASIVHLRPISLAADDALPSISIEVDLPAAPRGISGPRLSSFASDREAMSGEVPGAVGAAILADSLPRLLAPLAPRYPSRLHAAGIEGKVVLEFIVDTAGLVERDAVTIVSATDSAFGDAATAALTASQFRSGWSAGKKARVRLRQAIVFLIR